MSRRALVARVLGLLRLRQVERELDDEILAHLEQAEQDNLRAGMPAEEARRAAQRSFGGVEQVKEAHRDVGGFPVLRDVVQDVRVAIRAMRRQPGFAMVVVFTLALGIGATTAMFSVLNAVLLRPLPYRAPEQLAMLWTEDPTQNLREVRSDDWNVAEWRCQSQSFADIAIFDSIAVTLTGADGAEGIAGASISPNLLSLLGVQPVQGRNFSPEEAAERQRVRLISHRFWQARFGGSSEAIGATIVLDGRPAQIIGILPAGFQVASFDADVWGTTGRLGDCESGHGPRGGDSQEWFAVGRLRPEVTFDQAQAEMSAIARRLDDQLPVAERNRGITVVPFSLHMVESRSRLALWMLGGAVLCVLLIAAANVASLSLARSVGRVRELAVRAALGASAGRIVRQLLTESLLLAAVSGVIGTLLAVAGIRFIRANGPDNLVRLSEASLDLRVLGWALTVSLLTGILVGLAPAMTTLRRSVRPSGEEGGRSVAGGAATRRVRRALVVAEFALAIVLLVGAGLLARSWWRVGHIDPGFRPERVLTMGLSATGFSDSAERSSFYDRVLEQIQAVPGVQSAGLSDDFFISNPKVLTVTIEGDDGTVSERLRLPSDGVSVDFFRTVGTELLRGRFFSVRDGAEAPQVAIVNEAMARRLWPARDAVGRRIKLGADGWCTVVGVVANMRRQGPEREPIPQMFAPLAQSGSAPSSVDLFIRTSTDDPVGMAGALRAAVGRVDKRAPVDGVVPLKRQLGNYLEQRRFQTSLVLGFSAVALLMAAVGIYGLIQYSVATRTQEIGMRMAVGAQSGDIFRMIIGEGLKLSLIGLALGLVGAFWVAQAGSNLLFGVTATDPLTFLTVSLLLLAVSIVACYVPARRATKVDPAVALRVE
ncbi:MAG: ADOP family duplicated permease [Vicinamibacteraceae bacterium]